MIFLSDLLGKNVYFDRKVYGKMVDFAVLESSPNPSVSKIVIKKGSKKFTITPKALTIKRFGGILNSNKVPFLPYDDTDFYLNEDLLDKQVIDTDEKKLVRVNDVALENEGELKVVGIDIGTAGILRRLSLGKIIKIEPKIIPWQMIEAFDFHTGNIKISLTQNKLSKMHPGELADILEDLGSKERLSVVQSLDAKYAAKTIEETDERTQEAIFEELKGTALGQIVSGMHSSALAEIFSKLNPLRIKEILKLLSNEKAQRIEKLMDFGTETAGGMMRTSFWKFDGNLTVKQAYNELFEQSPKPEVIVVTNGNEKLVGTINTKDMLDSDSLAILKDIVSERKFVYPTVGINELIFLFAKYNLRLIPVVDKDKKPIGVVKIDRLLEKIEERIKEDEFI